MGFEEEEADDEVRADEEKGGEEGSVDIDGEEVPDDPPPGVDVIL